MLPVDFFKTESGFLEEKKNTKMNKMTKRLHKCEKLT